MDSPMSSSHRSLTASLTSNSTPLAFDPPASFASSSLPPPAPSPVPPPLHKCPTCSAGPFDSKRKLRIHRSTRHNLLNTTQTPQGSTSSSTPVLTSSSSSPPFPAFSASRGDDDRLRCPLCPKSFAYSSGWSGHVKACAKAKEETERCEVQAPPPRRTPSLSDAGSVYGMDIDGTSTGDEDQTARPHTHTMPTPSSSSANQLPPTPLSIAQSFGLAISTSPSNNHALPPPPPLQFDLSGSSYSSSTSRPPTTLVQQPTSAPLCPFDQREDFAPYYPASRGPISTIQPSFPRRRRSEQRALTPSFPPISTPFWGSHMLSAPISSTLLPPHRTPCTSTSRTIIDSSLTSKNNDTSRTNDSGTSL